MYQLINKSELLRSVIVKASTHTVSIITRFSCIYCMYLYISTVINTLHKNEKKKIYLTPCVITFYLETRFSCTFFLISFNSLFTIQLTWGVFPQLLLIQLVITLRSVTIKRRPVDKKWKTVESINISPPPYQYSINLQKCWYSHK